MNNIKRIYYFFLHFLFITGIIYAVGQFITTPKTFLLERRLWAYESWIILSFYLIFAYLTIIEKEINLNLTGKRLREKGRIFFEKFQRILTLNLILLIFPWGLFLILAPHDLLSLLRFKTIYWRVLGFMSLVGAAIYYLPLKFYKSKTTFYIFIFGFVDNLIAAIILTFLFITKRVTLLQWSASPLLFYFSIFFLEQAKEYKKIIESLGWK